MNKRLSLSLLSAVLASVLAAPVLAGEIVPVNFDDPGIGLNDTTPKAPQGGNPGTTLGDQRQIVYQFAANLWGSVLKSDTPVYVGASFAPLACTPTSGVLGSAGATSVFSDFAPGVVPGTWYSGALADVVQNPRFSTACGLLIEAQTQRKRGLKVRETRDVKQVFGRMRSWFEKNF